MMLLLFLHCLCIIVSISKVESSDLRNDPRLPLAGIKNWELLESQTAKFTPRHSHATTVFKCPDTDNSGDLCIWLTGGYSNQHKTFSGATENANSDVWRSRDGQKWSQVELYGDFPLGNENAKPGGYTAPWFSRFGHSLNALDADDDGINDVMVLVGGFSPVASNDVWITTDGKTWFFDGYAPFPKRAYHGSTVFQNKLFILGGSPMSNDVWAGSLVKDDAESRGAGFRMEWQLVLANAPWTPRAGFCAVSQTSQVLNSTTLSTETEMFILGGYAPSEDDPLELNGTRARNDVWETKDGASWEKVLTPMPWGPRAFHSCVSWHGRIVLSGGGYIGRSGNREVRELQAYTDLWSYDASDWVRVNYQEGSKHTDNLYSTNEWTETFVDGRKIHRGKWGHTTESFHVRQLNEDDFGTSVSNDVAEETIPSLFIIGGKPESEDMVNDVFISKPGVLCEVEGITCSRNGECGPQGCICHSGDFYCQHKQMRRR